MAGEPLRIDASEAALLMMDLQNASISQGDGAKHAESQNLAANVSRLASEARSLDVPVVHVHLVIEPDARGLKLNAPLFHRIKQHLSLVRGSWGALPAKGLEPQEGDLVVEKMRMNSFFGTPLEPLLRGLGVETVILTGASTNIVVEHTARHAADLGFEVVVAEDGTSCLGDEWQRASIDYALPIVSKVATCEEIVEALRR